MILRLNKVFCLEFRCLMAYLMIWQWTKQVKICRDLGIRKQILFSHLWSLIPVISVVFCQLHLSLYLKKNKAKNGYSIFLMDTFPYIREDLFNLKLQNQAKNIPLVLPSSPIERWGKSIQGFMRYDWTHKPSVQL